MCGAARAPGVLDGRASGGFDEGMSMRRAQLSLAALVALCFGCLPPTQVTVVITTNVPCDTTEGTAIIVGSRDEVETKAPITITPTCEEGRIGTFVIAPGKDREATFVVKLVTGVGVLTDDCLISESQPDAEKGKKGCIVARRELSFVPQTPLTLPVLMRRACIGVICKTNETCAEDGVCVSDKIGDPLRCADPGGCDETSLGGTGGGSSSSGMMSSSASMMMSSSSGMMSSSSGMMSSSSGMMSSSSGMAGAGGMMTTTTVGSSGSGMAGAGGMMTTTTVGSSGSGMAGAGGMMTTTTVGSSGSGMAGAGGMMTTTTTTTGSGMAGAGGMMTTTTTTTGGMAGAGGMTTTTITKTTTVTP
jgi:hypothetical protein